MSGSIDTNILLRLIIGDIPDQTLLVTELIDRSDLLEVADQVFVEAEYVLRKGYNLDRSQVAKLFSETLTHPKLSCSAQLLNKVLETYSGSTGISFADIYLAELSVIHNSNPLFTFDKELAKKISHTKLLV
jgi:uncharacterized protein